MKTSEREGTRSLVSGLMITALVLVGLIYGGLNFARINRENQELKIKSFNLADELRAAKDANELKIAEFEKILEENNLRLDEFAKKIATNETKIKSYQQTIANLTKEEQEKKEVLGATDTAPVIEPVEIKPAIAQTPAAVVPTPAKPKSTYYINTANLKQASVTVDGLGTYKVNLETGDTAFTALQRAAKLNNFSLKYQSFDIGVFVTEIGGVAATGNQYWAFYYNGAYANVGASAQLVKNGDTISWKLESF